MSRKTISMFVIDAGSTMQSAVKDGELGNEINRFDVALSSATSSIIQKSSSKTFEAGVCIYGSGTTNNLLVHDEGFYENVDEKIPIGRCTLAGMKDLLSVKPGPTSGDLIDSLVVGTHSLTNYQTGKANKGSECSKINYT